MPTAAVAEEAVAEAGDLPIRIHDRRKQVLESLEEVPQFLGERRVDEEALVEAGEIVVEKNNHF